MFTLIHWWWFWSLDQFTYVSTHIHSEQQTDQSPFLSFFLLMLPQCFSPQTHWSHSYSYQWQMSIVTINLVSTSILQQTPELMQLMDYSETYVHWSISSLTLSLYIYLSIYCLSFLYLWWISLGLPFFSFIHSNWSILYIYLFLMFYDTVVVIIIISINIALILFFYFFSPSPVSEMISLSLSLCFLLFCSIFSIYVMH